MLTVTLLLFLPNPISGRRALADDSSMGRNAEGVFPIGDTEVEMVAEDVTIRLLSRDGQATGQAEADCRFTFHNTSSEAVEVLVGFPGEFITYPDDESHVTSDALTEFRAFVDGEEVPVTLETGVAGPEEERQAFASWYTFTVSFAPDQTRTVVNTYKFWSSGYSNGEVNLCYTLSTGRYWKGTIGRATVTLELGDLGPYQLMGFRPDGKLAADARTITWEWTDLEPYPGSDIRVDFNVTWWPNYATPGSDLEAWQNVWDGTVAYAQDWDPEGFRDFYRRVVRPALTAETSWDPGGYREVFHSFLDPLLQSQGFTWVPPSVLALQPTQAEQTGATPLLGVTCFDSDWDIVSAWVKVTHLAGSGPVEDLNYTLGAGADWPFDWAFDDTGLGTATLPLRFYPRPDSLYTIEVTLRDAHGYTATGSTTALIPYVPAARPLLWTGLGLVALALAAGACLLISRHRRSRRPPGSDAPPA